MKKKAIHDKIISFRISSDLLEWINKQPIDKSELIRLAIQQLKDSGSLEKFKADLKEAFELVDNHEPPKAKLEILQHKKIFFLQQIKDKTLDLTTTKVKSQFKNFLTQLNDYGLDVELNEILTALKELAKK